MGTRSTPRSFEDFQPSIEWDEEEGSDILRIALPGFKMDQMKVQMDTLGNLRVSGERPLSGNRWSRFRKDFRIPQDCNTSEIRAKFEDEILYIAFPRSIAKSGQHYQPKPIQESMTSPKAASKSKIGEDQDRKNQKGSLQPSDKPDQRTEQLTKVKTNESVKPIDGSRKNDARKNEFDYSKKATNDIAANVGEPDNGQKRETIAKETPTGEAANGHEKLKPRLNLSFDKPNQLLINVVVAVVVLVGLTFYMYFGMKKKSIGTDCRCN